MRRLTATSAIVASLLLSATQASAQTPSTINLRASAQAIGFGQSVALSGAITPPVAGLEVQIEDGSGVTVARATTDGGGAFAVTISPEHTDAYAARVEDQTSPSVTVLVRADVSVRMSPVRLFDRVIVRGTILPPRPGRPVVVELTQGERVISSRRVAMGQSGGFTAALEVTEPGTYRARASFTDADLSRGTASTGPDRTPLPHLASGDHGTFVRLLERRLVELHYRLSGAGDGRYDLRTADAVVAFHKVQKMERTFVVDAATWRRLADPRLPVPRRRWNGFHVEVDQSRQVLYTVADGKIMNVLHISTGAGGATRDGTFHVYRKLAGFSPNHLYYPSYFDGLRALHGWTEVPTYAASHGCVRIPYWNARWVYGLTDYGTRVVIYH